MRDELFEQCEVVELELDTASRVQSNFVNELAHKSLTVLWPEVFEAAAELGEVVKHAVQDRRVEVLAL